MRSSKGLREGTVVWLSAVLLGIERIAFLREPWY